METESQDQQEISKKDDFFDEDTPKQNGDLPAGITEEDKPKEEPPSENKDGGDTNPDVDEASCENNTQDLDAVAASGGDGGDCGDQAVPPAEEGAEPAAAAKPDETPDEGFQSTSPPPAPDAPSQQPAEDTAPVEEDQTEESPTVADPTDQDASDPSKPEADQDKDSVQDVEATKDEQNGPECQGEDDTPGTTLKSDEPEDKPEPETEVETDVAKYENDYEDSFSQCSQKSLASIDSTGKTMNAKIEVSEKEQDELKPEETLGGIDESAPTSPTPVIKAASPTPSRDSRAEGSGTIDTPVVEQVPVTDGRSSVEVKENGEYRGEDRTEGSVPEGTEDSRGQGQWKSPEDQYIASAVLAHKTEQEALKEVQEERDRLLEDQENLKSSLNALEDELVKKSDLLVAEREINASRDKKIKALQDELAKLYAKNEEGSEERIKDLQERLAVLARSNEEKEQLIQRLNEQLKETNLKLKESEKQLAISEQERAKQAANAAEAPKSKTCIVM